MNIEEVFPDGVWAKSDEYVVRCPFCGDHPTHNHLYINTEKRVFHCFYCGEHGSIKKLLDFVGEKGVKVEPRKGVIEKKKYPEVDFSQFYPVTGVENTNDRLAFTYLKSRGLTKEEIKKYRIQYSPYGRYFGRVIVPIFEAGELVCFVARSFLHFIEPKYLFPHYGETQLTSSEALFGYDRALELSRSMVVIVEGVFDAMAVNRADPLLLGIALLSKHMSEGQLYKLLRLEAKLFYVMLDSDAHSETVQIAKQLVGWGRNTKVCLMKEGDPAALSERQVFEELGRAKEFSFDLEMEVALEYIGKEAKEK